MACTSRSRIVRANAETAVVLEPVQERGAERAVARAPGRAVARAPGQAVARAPGRAQVQGLAQAVERVRAQARAVDLEAARGLEAAQEAVRHSTA